MFRRSLYASVMSLRGKSIFYEHINGIFLVTKVAKRWGVCINNCNHKLGFIKNIICSGPFKQKCSICGVTLYRKHPKASFVGFEPFMGLIWLIALCISLLLIMFFPWVVSFLIMFFSSLYLWDTSNEPLQEFTENDRNKENIKNKQLLFGILIFGLILVFTNFLSNN